MIIPKHSHQEETMSSTSNTRNMEKNFINYNKNRKMDSVTQEIQPSQKFCHALC